MSDSTNQAPETEAPAALPDTTVSSDTHSYSVQSSPPLVIATDKESGEEVHHQGSDAFTFWEEIKHLYDEAKSAMQKEVEEVKADLQGDAQTS